MKRDRILHFLISTASILWATEAAAQGSDTTRAGSIDSIRGAIFDGTTQEPLPGVTLRLLVTNDSTGTATRTGLGAVSNTRGAFVLSLPDSGSYVLEIESIGYRSRRIAVLGLDSDLRISLYPELNLESGNVSVSATRRSRSVEDGCCRVESIRDEVQQHAPFSPSPVESLSRYSSCTSGRVINSIDNAGTVSLRGLEPTRVGLMLDDVPLFTGLSRFYGLALIPSHSLQTIRITEGASDTRYGDGAISGVVNLETRPPTEQPELNASVAALGDFGGADQTDINLGYTGMHGGLGLAGFGSYNRHNTTLDDIGGTLDRSYERGSAVLKGNILVDDRTELTATVIGGSEKREGFVRSDNSESTYEHSLRLNRVDGILTLSRYVGELGELRAIGAVSAVDAQGAYGTVALEGDQTVLYGETRYTNMFADHSLAAGLQAHREDFSETRPGPLEYSSTMLSAYAQDAWAFSDSWTALAGGRIDRHSSAGTNIAPRGSIRFAPSDALTFRVMAGGGLKADATFDEEFGILTGAYRWVPNGDLGYERSWTLNFDMSYDFLIGDVAGVNTNFNTYYTLIDGRHTPDLDSLGRGSFFVVNDDDPARLTGFELQGRWTIGDGWSGSVALSMIDYTTLNDAGERESVPLSPTFNVDASVMYRLEEAGFTAEVWGSRIGSQRLPIPIGGMTESVPYTIVNVRAEKELGPVALFAGVQNALDERQAETSPLVLRTGEIPNGGMTWGLAEGRELFIGIRTRILWGE